MLLNNRYYLQNHIVDNPTSTTYSGLDTHTGQGVSVILLRENHKDDMKFVRLFQREAVELLSSQRISNYGQSDGRYFLVIEHLEEAQDVENVSELLTKKLH